MNARFVFAAGLVALAGCASTIYNASNPSLMLASTPGEYFRRYLAIADADCRERQLGPYLPADEPPRSSRRAISDCRFITLKPWQPGDSPESAYAHSLKLPPPHDKPVDVYKPGMSPHEYFEALCAAQAGEFVFKRISGVEGIVELRPRSPESSERDRHLTAFEDPATYVPWQSRAVFNLSSPELYKFVDQRIDDQWLRYRRDPDKGIFGLRKEVIARTDIKFGFTWRGIVNEDQLNLGIAGGEFLVVDIEKNEVITLKRSFKLRWLGRYPSEQGISITGFERGRSCSAEIAALKGRKHQDFLDFLVEVLVPN